MVMTINNYEGASDLFTWPNNPNVYDNDTNGNLTFTTIAYQKHHMVVSGGGISPKTIILTGQFNGSSKRTSYRSLCKHFNHENYKLKKLYWETDKFMLGVGVQCKETNSGARTSFVDYVASFTTILGILLDNTQQTYTNGGTHKTNSGDVTTFIEEITGVVTSGSSDVTLTDGFSNRWTIPAASVTTGQTIVVTFVTMVDSGDGVYTSEYNYATVAASPITSLESTLGDGIIRLAAGATTSTLSATNLNAGWTAKFRNGWSA